MNLENNISILTTVEFEIANRDILFHALQDSKRYFKIFDIFFPRSFEFESLYLFFRASSVYQKPLIQIMYNKILNLKKKKLLVYEETWKSSLFRSLRVTPRNLTVSSRVNKRTYIYIGVSLANNSRLIHVYPRGRALFDNSTSLEYIGN